MAGTTNQQRLAVLQRLRQRARGRDQVVLACMSAAAAVADIDVEIDRLQAEHDAKLAALRARRASAAARRRQLLVAVAADVGDDEAARLLGLSPVEVRDARQAGANVAGSGGRPVR